MSALPLAVSRPRGEGKKADGARETEESFSREANWLTKLTLAAKSKRLRAAGSAVGLHSVDASFTSLPR